MKLELPSRSGASTAEAGGTDRRTKLVAVGLGLVLVVVAYVRVGPLLLGGDDGGATAGSETRPKVGVVQRTTATSTPAPTAPWGRPGRDPFRPLAR